MRSSPVGSSEKTAKSSVARSDTSSSSAWSSMRAIAPAWCQMKIVPRLYRTVSSGEGKLSAARTCRKLEAGSASRPGIKRRLARGRRRRCPVRYKLEPKRPDEPSGRLSSPRLDQPALISQHHSLHPVPQPKLHKDPRHVRL